VDVRDLPDVPVPAEMEDWADRDLLRRAVATLDPDHVEPLLLHHVWGFSFDEIAGMVGLSAAAARARSSRAMAALRDVVTQMKGSK
jgi:RNA polymerase sigma-70 factor (ECF subfamily)